MATGLALAVYVALLVPVAVAVWRRPVRALYLFVVGLAAHNAAMAALYGIGVRGGALNAIQAWKELLLAVALLRVVSDAWRARRLPFALRLVDWLALAFAGLVLLYAVLPQSALAGAADSHGRLLALRHDLAPVAAFLLGRSLGIGVDDLRRLGWTLLGAAALVAGIGLVDLYAVPIGWWRDSSVPGYFRVQLGYDYHGTGGLPENFVYNTGSEDHFLRRLVSVFLSPLASGYTLVVALLAAAAGGPLARRPRLTLALAAVAAVGLLFTFSRTSLVALALGLVLLALLRRRAWLAGAAATTVVVAVAWASIFPHVAREGHWTQADLVYQRRQAQLHPGASGNALSPSEASARSHLDSLRAGLRTVVHHPQGYGLGNAGTVAARTHVPIKAGESSYTELGVDTGLLGMVVFAAWGVVLLTGLVRSALRAREPTLRWAAASTVAALVAVLALAVQTDVLGVPWLTFCLWWVGGALVSPAPATEPAARDERAAKPAPRTRGFVPTS